jgi:glycosyltransferase involved in cell wall biosynthesis
VLVLPSDGGETWGLVVNEAMVCGLPAIVSDAVGCGPDLIENGKTGFTYPLGDCLELARRIQSLAEMKQAGHDFAPALAEKMRSYSVEAAVRGTIQAAEKLAQ